MRLFRCVSRLSLLLPRTAGRALGRGRPGLVHRWRGPPHSVEELRDVFSRPREHILEGGERPSEPGSRSCAAGHSHSRCATVSSSPHCPQRELEARPIQTGPWKSVARTRGEQPLRICETVVCPHRSRSPWPGVFSRCGWCLERSRVSRPVQCLMAMREKARSTGIRRWSPAVAAMFARRSASSLPSTPPPAWPGIHWRL